MSAVVADLFPHTPRLPRTFVVAGEPVPWARAGGNGPRRFNPPEMVEHQRLVRDAARQAGVRVHPGPIGVDLVASTMFPRSWKPAEIVAVLARMKGNLAICGAPKLSRPDIDNVAKLVLDALNGTAFDDDAEVFMVRPVKVWGPRSETHVRLWYGTTPPEFPERWWDADPFTKPAS